MKPGRILLLEDSADDAELITELIADHLGAATRVDHAAEVEEADRLLDAADDYDLILVDYMLGTPPDGAEWTAQAAARRSLPPVIMLTGMPDAPAIERIAGRMPEISWFVTKDRLAEELPRAIDSAMANRPDRPSCDGIILLADDDADDRLLIEDALREVEGEFRLDLVGDGAELMAYLHRRGAFRHLAGTPLPGLILLDLNMPRMDGRMALRALRSDPELRRIPVVILSASDAGCDIQEGYELGANSFVCKPASFDGLVTMMRTLTDYWFRLVALPVRLR
ncbi:MAG: response regulator [Zetaproteobacteria bacterium]|nr:MAG: response regulator [Zetaproteobacteria bacterium]